MKNVILSILMLCLAVVCIAIEPNNMFNYAMLIGTAAGGIGTAFQFNMTYLPEFIQWNDAGNAINFLRVETTERGVVMDLLAADIAQFNGILNVGAQIANENRLILADGHIKGQNVIISGTTSAAGAINFFGNSDNSGVSLFRYKNVNIIANNETEFRKFSILSMPNLVTVTDRVQVFFNDGHSQVFDSLELQNLSTMWNDAPVIAINNLQSYIDKVLVTSALGGACTVLSVDM